MTDPAQIHDMKLRTTQVPHHETWLAARWGVRLMANPAPGADAWVVHSLLAATGGWAARLHVPRVGPDTH